MSSVHCPSQQLLDYKRPFRKFAQDTGKSFGNLFSRRESNEIATSHWTYSLSFVGCLRYTRQPYSLSFVGCLRYTRQPYSLSFVGCLRYTRQPYSLSFV